MNKVLVTIFSALIAVLFLTRAASAQCGSTQLVANQYTQYLTSPGYPGIYPNDVTCVWRITTYEATTLIRLLVLGMSLENVVYCTYDNVSIYDGNVDKGNLLETMCGNISSIVFTTTGSVMTVVFRSDVSNGYKGFEFAYRTVNKTGQSLRATNTDQYLTSPNYPLDYPNNALYYWTITADFPSQYVVLKVLDFQLESGTSPTPCQFDSLSIYNGIESEPSRIKTLCGQQLQQTITSSGNIMTLVFQSDATIEYRGFKLQYTSPGLCSDVNLQADVSTKYFNSPNYPSSYPNNAFCRWNITSTSSGKIIALTALDFDLGPSTSCNYGHVNIYDGSISLYQPMAILCGQLNITTFASTGKLMIVEFAAGSINTNRGFKFTYTLQDQCTYVQLFATAEARYITSIGYPYGSPSNTHCEWHIAAPSSNMVIALKVLNFHLDNSLCENDYVTIYDGDSTVSNVLQKLCGQIPETTYTSTGIYMTVVFKSGYSATNFRFRLQYTSQNISAFCGLTSLHATETAQYLTSYGYPNNYPCDMDCQWTISTSSQYVVKLNLIDVRLGIDICFDGYLSFYDGDSTSSNNLKTVCSTSNVNITSTSYIITVVFHSDSCYSHTGFKIQYMSINKPALCGSTSLYATVTTQYLTSFGYPNNYPSDLDCQWKISTSSQYVVRLNLIDVRLDNSIASLCIDDYLSFYDGDSTSSNKIKTVCSTSNVNITSTSSAITVVFHSDGSYSYTGFKLQYTSIDKSALCGSALLHASETQQYLTSYGYPNNYPSDMDCQWRISTSSDYVIQIILTDVRLDDGLIKSCSNDYISIYDGDSTNSTKKDALCQTSNYNITSTKNIVTVVFHSDRSISYTGFKLQYASIDKPVPCESYTEYSTYGIHQINSPKYPDLYPSNSDCEWLIYRINGEAISLNVSIIKLERNDNYCIDYVAIYDGPKTNSTRVALLCGNASVETYKITSRYATVVFHCDWSINYGGFSINFTSTHFEEYDYTTKDFNARSDDQSTSGLSAGGIVIICSCVAFVLAILGFVVLCVRRRKARKHTRNSAVRRQQNNSNSGHQSTPRRQNTQETSLSIVSPASINSLVTPTAPPYAELPRPQQNTATSNIYERIRRFFNNATRNPSRPPRANTPTSTSITNQRPQSGARTNEASDFSNRTELARSSIVRENIYGEILATINSRPAVDTSNPPSYAEATASGSNMTIPARCDGEPIFEYLVVKVRRNR